MPEGQMNLRNLEKKSEELGADTALRNQAAQITALMHQVENGLLDASARVKDNVGQTMKNSKALIEKWQLIQVVLTIAAIILALTIGILVAASIVRPVQSAITILKDIAQGEGNLTMRLREKGKDEISSMAGWFNLFVEKIQSIILEMAANTQVLDKGSRTLLTLSQTLSQSAENTSGTVEEVSESAGKTSSMMDAVARQSSEASGNIQS